MAACKKCGKKVGCGCSLNKDGVCATCAQNPPVVKPVTEPKK